MLKAIFYSTADTRGNALMKAILRLRELEGKPVTIEEKRIKEVIKQLQEDGCLTTNKDGDFYYTPSQRTRVAVSKALSSEGWDGKILKKMQGAFKPPADGAIFKFRVEGAEGKTVEAFITDWSPFPAAAAIAVHPSHPILQGKRQEQEEYFSGIWVRHSLTGDLLPVWVCSWVRPDFGTGAVIVNPAHSSVDLEFAQKVGLPIRFALGRNQPTANQATWEDAPIMKTGKTIKTGKHEGLSPAEAVDYNYKELAEHGWAEKTMDKPPAEGAICKFPIDGAERKTLEAFITDWSSLPAVAAIAVHPSHPILEGKHQEKEEYFSGIWVRNSLTGDLLPVWVCAWVRLDTGNAAVIVNPAHNAADLEFAQRVGLPIRFALGHNQHTANPTTWENAPIIKSGKTIRAGRQEGLNVDSAVDSYYQELAEHGWAEKIIDPSLRQGSIKIASANFTAEPLLDALLSIDPAKPFKMHCPTGESDSTLLLARHLWEDLYKQPFKPIVQLWQPVATPKNDIPNFDLAILSSGPLEDQFKKQIQSQCDKFVRNHTDVVAYQIGGVNPPSCTKVKEELLNGNYHTAFKLLVNLQNEVTKMGSKSIVPAGYFACAYFLANGAAPAGLDLSAAWASIGTDKVVLKNQGTSDLTQAPTSTSDPMGKTLNSDVKYTATQSFMPPPAKLNVLEDIFENGKKTIDAEQKVILFTINENHLANQFVKELQQKSEQLGIKMEAPVVRIAPAEYGGKDEYIVGLPKDDYNRLLQDDNAFDKLLPKQDNVKESITSIPKMTHS